ncbi:hypothetical protein KKC59_04295 [bacterium]|nr:hypothetical protein [bacterium]
MKCIESVYASETSDALFEEAKVCFIREDYQSALPKFRSCLKEDNNSVVKDYINLCEKHLKWEKENQNKFLDLTKREKELFLSQEVDMLNEAGINCFYIEKYDLSLIQFEKVLILDNSNPTAQKYINIIKDKKEEIKKFKDKILALEINTDESRKAVQEKEILFRLAKELYLKGSYELALEKFKELKSKYNKDVLIDKYIDLCKTSISKAKEKEEQFLQIKEREDLQQLIREKSLIEDLRKEKEMSNLLEEQIDKHNRTSGLFDKGKDFYLKGYFKLALEYFEQILLLDPKHELAKNYKKLAVENIAIRDDYEKKLLSESQEQFSKKIEVEELKLKTDQTRKLYLEGKDLFNNKNYDEAKDKFKQVLEILPNDYNAEVYIALCASSKELQDISENESAKTQLLNTEMKKTLEQEINKQKRVIGLFEKGKKYYFEEDFNTAITYFNSVLDIDSNHKMAKHYKILAEENISLRNEYETKLLSESQKNMSKKIELEELKIKTDKIRQLYIEAKSFFDQKNYTDAQVKFKEIVHLDPKDSNAQVYITLCNSSIDLQNVVEKETAKAEFLNKEMKKQLEEEINKQKKIIEFFENGRKLYFEDNYEGALSYFDKVLLIDNKHELAKYYSKLAQDNISFREEEEKKKAQKQKSIQQLENAVKKQQEIASLFREGKEAYRAKKYDKAKVFFEKILILEPGEIAVKEYVGLCCKYLELEKQKEKETIVYEKMRAKNILEMDEIIRDHNQINDLLAKGKKLYEDGLFELSKEKFEEVLQIDKNNFLAQQYVKFCEGQIEISKETKYNEIVRKDFELERKKQMEQIIQHYSEINKILEQGKSVYLKGEYEAALVCFLEVLKIAPENRYAKEYMGLCNDFIEIKEDRINKNLIEIKGSIKDKSNELFFKGKELFRQGKYEESLSNLKKAWKINPGSEYLEEIQKYIEEIYFFVQENKNRAIKDYYSKQYIQGLEYYHKKMWWPALLAFKEVSLYDPLFEDVKLYQELARQNWEESEINKIVAS